MYTLSLFFTLSIYLSIYLSISQPYTWHNCFECRPCICCCAYSVHHSIFCWDALSPTLLPSTAANHSASARISAVSQEQRKKQQQKKKIWETGLHPTTQHAARTLAYQSVVFGTANNRFHLLCLNRLSGHYKLVHLFVSRYYQWLGSALGFFRYNIYLIFCSFICLLLLVLQFNFVANFHVTNSTHNITHKYNSRNI